VPEPGLAQYLSDGSVNTSPHKILLENEAKQFIESLPSISPIRIAHEYWSALSEINDGFPDRRDIDPIDIGSTALPHIVIIDVEGGERIRYRYRLIGGYVEDIFGANYAGQYLDEMDLGSMLDVVSTFFSIAGEQGQVAILDGDFLSQAQTAYHVSRIAMPLTVGSKPIGALFCAFDNQEISGAKDQRQRSPLQDFL
jgi:hypothetical protein